MKKHKTAPKRLEKQRSAPARAAQPKRAPVASESSASDSPEVAESEWEAPPRLVRLNKFLADNGVAARRRCDELISEGKVMVDGESVTELGLKIDPARQEVEVDGFVFKARAVRKRYYLLNKPSGVVCTNEPRETRPRAVDLITDPFKGRIYTVGRLDEDSKGLLVLTNDGDFANRVQHPRYGIEKTYLVKVAGEIDDATLKEVREGVHLSEGRTAGARIVVHDRGRDYSLLSISIREGMNREIRRVFARFGFKVTELKRIRIGTLTDRGLKPGRWREMLSGEVTALLAGENTLREPEGSSTEGRARAPSGGRGLKGRGPKGVTRVRGAAPFSRPKKRGYARHLVQGGRAVERRPDAPPRFGDRERERERGADTASNSAPGGRSGKIYGRTSARPRGPAAPVRGASAPSRRPGASARGSSAGARSARPGAARVGHGPRGGKSNSGPKAKVGRKQRGER